jgi:hypothetical protein
LSRWVSAAARGGLAASVFLLVTAWCRWEPIHARGFFGVRAREAAAAAVACAILAALTARERRPRAVRGAAVFTAACALALAAVVALRPPSGLPATVFGPSGVLATLPPGAIDVIGRDLGGGLARRTTVRWSGPLHVTDSGRYRIWAAGRGAVDVDIDGRPALRAAEADPLSAGADVALTRGEHTIDVTLRRIGPGPRLRLGWTGPDGRAEAIPPRRLGEEPSLWWWRLTDGLARLLALGAAVLVFHLRWERPLPLPAPGPVTRREISWSLAGHLAAVAAMSWPLVADLAGHGVTDRPDGRLNAWILAWDVHALRHAPGRLFDAPIFHPLPDALAFSENLLLPAVLSAPAQLLGPAAAYNVTLLASLVLSGLGAQLLARRASGARWAAFVGGVMFAAGAHRWTRLAHLHAQVTVFLPLALLALDRFRERRTWPRALLVGLLLGLQGLSSVYLGAITALALAVAIAVGAGTAFRGRELVRLAGGFVLAAAMVAPVARPYLRMRAHQGVEFTLADVALYATTPESYAASGTRLLGPITQRHLDPERVRDALFPGFAMVVLGLVGLARAPRRFQWVALAASAAAIAFSLGPETAAYRFLHEHLVLVRGIRALSRFSLVAVLALAVLSALALARRRWLSVAALLVFAMESSLVPIRYAPAPAPADAARWLAGREGAVAYLPLGERDTDVMLDGVAHFRPLLNGDSGFMPRPYSRAMELLQPPIGEEALRFLRAAGVREVVSRDDVGLPVLAAFEGERVFAVPGGVAAEVVRPAAHTGPTAWTAEGAVVDLGAPRTIGRAVFEVADGEWVAEPRIEVSDDGASWRRVHAVASLADAVASLYADPKSGRGEVRFAPSTARWIRLDPRVPARPPFVWVD